MSSKENPNEAFPIVCEQCGQRTAMPNAQATPVDEKLQLAVRCSACAHTWLVRAPNSPFTVRRKSDRRAVPRYK